LLRADILGCGRERGGVNRGRAKEREREEVRIRVSTLVVHPMQDTARHDPRSPCRIPVPMHRVNCPARYRAARRGTL